MVSSLPNNESVLSVQRAFDRMRAVRIAKGLLRSANSTRERRIRDAEWRLSNLHEDCRL